jgi:hypothetical protein
MKKILAILALTTRLMFAQATTPNINLQIPAYGNPGWQSSLDYNFYQIDKLLSGNLALPSVLITGSAVIPNITTWLTGSTYASGAFILYNGNPYYSVSNGNQGNLPTNTTFWTPGTGSGGGGGTIPVTTAVLKGTNTAGVATAAGQGDFYNIEYLSFSATPVFSPTFHTSNLSLSGAVTSFTMTAGTDGQEKCLVFQHDATGNAYTVTPPANLHGFMTVGTQSNKWSQQCFTYIAFNSIWIAQSSGVINE